MSIPVMFRNHFQLGYAVRNMDKAIENMRNKFGITKWQVLRLPEHAPGRALGFAYVQNMMIEFVEAKPDRLPVFRDWIPESDSSARLHHLGYMAESEEDWHSIIAQFEAAGIPTVLNDSLGDLMDYRYFDTVAQLGHYCEFVRLKPAGRDFWANVPYN